MTSGVEYHEATKHSYDSVREDGPGLDWAHQPDPFRRYAGSPLFLLETNALPETGTLAAWSAMGREPSGGPPPDRAALGTLLWNSLAVNGWKEIRGTGSRWPLRANPSAGNLHPNELHLFIRGVSGLPDGCYHYRPDLHALERRLPPESFALLLEALPPETAAAARRSRIAAVLTTIPWRQAWKYRARGWRYCLLDGGHALAALALAASALGQRVECRTRFADDAVAAALALEESGATDEHPLALLLVGEADETVSGRENSGDADLPPPATGRANPLGAGEIRYPLIDEALAASRFAAPLPEAAKPLPPFEIGEAESISIPGAPGRDDPLSATVQRRRSAQRFRRDGGPLPWRDFGPVLAALSTGIPGDLDPSLLVPYVFIHASDGPEPGLYRLDDRGSRLTLLKGGNLRSASAYLDLEQDLGGDGGAAFILVGRLGEAAAARGERGYRDALLAAGAAGHLVYLGAEAIGWNATGIGAFYDDDAARALALPPGRWPVYHHTVGRAAPDPRLTDVTREMLSALRQEARERGNVAD